MMKAVPHTKTAIVVETRTEKHERKLLAQERRQERLVEQQKIVQQMEILMEKVIHRMKNDILKLSLIKYVLQIVRETPLPKKDEMNLRQKIKSIVTKVNKDLDRSDISSLHPSLIEPTSSTSQMVSVVNPTLLSLESVLNNVYLSFPVSDSSENNSNNEPRRVSSLVRSNFKLIGFACRIFFIDEKKIDERRFSILSLLMKSTID